MAETKPTSLLEIGLAKSKKVAEQRKKATSTTPTSGQSAATATQPVVEKRGETPEERATYARLMKANNDLVLSSLDRELSKMDSAKEKMSKTAANVAKLQSEMKPQEHDPRKVDSGRIMQQNITQRAAQKMVDEPTSVEGVEDKSKAAAKYFGFEPYILKPDVQSRKAMRDVFDSTDPLYESQGLAAAFKYIDTLPTNEEGKIVVDGVPYSRMELAQGLAPQIVSANSGSLFANNATYRDDMAKRMGYKNMDSYVAALDQRLAAMQKDLANHVSAQHAIQTPFNDMAGLEALATQERVGAKVIRDLRDQIKSMRAGEGGFEQFFKGLNEGFDAVNMATFGIADLASEYKQNVVYNKMLNGETLTPEERILADALNIKSDLDALREAQGQSWYNNIGAGVGYIAEIAPQFVGPMLAAKGLFKPINVGAKGAWEMTKKAAKKEGFKGALKTGLGATARVGVKGLNNMARFQINGMLTAPLQASTYSRFLEKRNAQYSIKDGKVTYTPTDAWRDLVDTWIEQGAEVGSELFGVSLEKFTSASLAAIGRNIGLGKMMRKIGGSVRNVETSKAMRFVKSGATKAGQQLFGYAGGVLPETLSEIYGDITSEMFKSVLTGNGNFEEFKNPTYWATAFALSGIYGGAMSVLPSMVDYASYMRDISALGNIKKKILSDGKIEHADLKNALITLSAGGSIKDATEHLAKLDWKDGGYSLEEIGYAMDYIRAEAMQQVRMGEATESQRLQRFGNVAQNIEAHAYRDEEGMPSGSMVMAVDKDGNSYHILEGDYSNKEATLKALNSEGKVVPLLASNIEGLSKASIADVTLFYYQQMFSTEFNLQRLESVEYAIERMDNPTMAQVADVAKRVGIVMPKEGDTITLVDGRTAKVTSISDDLGIMAEMTDGEGNISQVTIPIMQILSSNTYIAEAQKLQNAEDALELAQAEEAQAEVEDAVEEGEATADVATETSNGIIGTEVTLPNGNKGTIVEVDGDDVVVDTGRGVDAYEVYSKEELGMTEAAETTTTQPTQTTAEQTTSGTATEQTTGEVTPEQATEALNEIADIKRVPALEDGSIDYDAIDDAETFAKHFEHDMGSREEAIEGVKEMREQAVADLAEAEKKGKKARSANEKVANKAERQRLAERIAFYDNVLDIYTPKAEAPATPIESAPQVDTTPSQTETQSPAEATEGVQPSETTAEDQVDGYSKYNEKLERRVGLQHNELSEQLEENTRRMINDVAAAFGVEVIFQREVRSSAGNLVNGKIDGSTVYFNWGRREHTLTWLMGHEFTHRMKSLSPEAYNKLRDAVRAYLGDEKWNQLIEKQRKIYEERENPEEILSSAESAAIWKEAKEQAKREDGSYNEEAAKKLYNKKVAEARREAYIEEVVCDEVGVLARDHKAFDRFLRSEHVRNDGKLLSWLRKVWQSLKSAFNHDARTFNEVMKTLDELINVSTAKVAKNTQISNEEKYAVTPEVAEATERIESNGGVVDTQRGDVKYALSDVLTIPERESAIQDLMRVTGRSRATVQKYLKAEQSLARIIADDDNRAFLDLQVDESVPSIWNNSDYPQGTVEFSNICRKRLPLTMIYQQLQKEFPNTVFDASTLETIRGVLKENGVDVACGLCFVEDRRQLLGEIGKGFISALKGENINVNEKQKEAIAGLNDTYIPDLYELLTLDGMKALKQKHPEVANAFIAYNNARGMQAGRLFQAYSAYHREILGYSEARVNKINASGGLRIFSFSDFEAHHLIDLVQVLTDCARKGIKVQGYTKVPEFARAVKDTGMKLNRSLIAKGDGYVDADYTPKKKEAVSPNVVDGKRLLLDCVEGIDVNHKDFFDSSSSHNVGNILVGINDEQIRLAMVDPFVDYIIPFHSGLSEAIRKQKGIGNWQNYKLEQLEKKDNGSGKLVNADKHGVNIYTEVLNEDIKTEKQFVERYIEVCKEKGWVPKFHRFLKKNKNGDFVYTKGYYKLLLDFKMFDSKGRILPQEVVQPIFDDAFNKEILEDYVKGEKAKMPNDEVYNKVREALNLGGEKLSLIGEVGASALDKAEEATVRLDDLNIARQMEERGDSALDIRMATGWERGADGLWRYEIPDVQIKRPDEWMDMRNIRLKDVVSGAEELFEAYPALADIKIKKGRGKGGGSYTHENKTIELGVAHLKGWIDGLRNPSAYYSSYEEIEAGLLRQASHLRSTLIHEIQHAIQRIEGFAQGGNSTMILDASARAKYDEMIESYNERVDKYNKMSVAEQGTTEGRDLANRLGSQRKAIDMFWKLNSIGASGYKRLAGEVEARNVEKRAGMPMAERLATLVEETEDVAREDQIFLRDGVEMAMAQPKYSLATDVASILEEYDTEGVKYGSILDVADGIESLIAESTEDTTELENILNDFRATQDDARRWGNRMDSGGEEEFEEALRAYVNKAALGERSDVDSSNSSSEGLLFHPSGRLRNSAYGGEIDGAKLREIDEKTKSVLQKIRAYFNGEWDVKNVKNVNEAVRVADKLGLRKSSNSNSYYGEYFEGDYGINGEIVRVRVSTHPANPLEITKVRKGVDPDHKVSIVIRKNGEHKSDGTPHRGYTEYVYEPSEVTPQDAADAVVKGLKSLLETGEFVDETGKAIRKDYPYTDNRGKIMYSLITPEMDASYLDAVERGDMTTAQRMVMEAAEKAGYTIRAYHGTPNKVYNPDWQDAVAEIVTILFPNEGEINMDAEYGTDEYRKAWDLAAEIRYNYREYREKLPKTLQRRFERGITKPFTVFDTEKMGSSTGARDAENGFFFSPNPLFASSFRVTFTKDPLTGVMSKTSSGDGVLYDVFIKPNNLLDLRSLPATRSKAKQMGNTDGYDVVINKVKDGRNRNKVEEEIMVKDPTLIKSADPVTYDDAGNIIPLSERFNPEKEDIRYSMQAPSLLGVHNISLDKLRKVIKMGGLANPSVAVIDVDKQTHDDYGEYSLILPKNMVDARQGKNAGTWAGDAWTPTYPPIIKRMRDSKVMSRFHKDIEALPEAMRSRVRLDFDSFMEGLNWGGLGYWYLHEKGIAPAEVLVPSRYSDDIANAVSEATNGTFNMYNLTPEERAKCLDIYIDAEYNGNKVAYEAELQKRKVRLMEKVNTITADRVRKWAQDKIDELNEYGFDYTEVSNFVRDVDADVRKKGTVDVEATVRLAKEQISEGKHDADFEEWLSKLEERYGIEEYIFDGFTKNGDRKYLLHTVENASKWMKKQGREGAVATFPSFGVFIANAIPKMRTLESIRKRKALLGKSKEEFETFKEKWTEVYHELGNKLQPDAKGFDDYGYWRLIEAVGHKNPKEFIKKEYGIEMSEEDMAKFNDMVNAIRTEYPARYFETKFERPLQLNDFTAAVVPNDIPLDVESRLRDANVEIFEYEKGDSNSRAEAMQKASAVENVRFSLIGERGASNIESYGRYGSPAYALEQARDMEADGKSVKEIRVATNWERGKDGKWRYEINDGVYTDPEDKDKEYKLSDILKNDALYEAYPELADMPLYYAELEDNSRGMYDGEAIWLSNTLDGQQAHSTLVHEVQHAIQHREGFARGGNKGMFELEAIEKLEKTLDDLEREIDELQSYNKLRKAYLILKYIANSLRLNRAENKVYEQYRRLAGEVEARNVQARMNMSEEERLLIPIGSTEDVARSSQNVIYRELMAADGTRYSLREESAPTRYSLQSSDMPFFDDNGDVITFDNTDITGEDYDAVELRSPKPTAPRTTEEVIKAHLSARHNAVKERIRRESRVLRDAVRKQYREEQVRRREGVESMRTNAAKVDYIIGAPIETLDYEAQVLAMIAMGTLSISWESLSKELGVKSGDKKSYRHITNGATATLDAVVHAWWESINGYENGIDTQDLRNALIDVLMQVPTAKGALSILEDRFDHALRNRDEALEDIDREEERLIAEEEARYNEQMTTLSDPARMSEYVRQYEQTVGFHEELTAIEGTLRKMDSELKAVRKRAERAQMRSRASKQKQFDKSKEIIGKQKEFYKDKLAEQRASFKEVREAIAESKRALLEALSTYEQLGFNKQEVRSLVDAVNKARSMADINKVRVKIENVILNVSIREKRRHMDQMLNLRLPSGELVETWVSKQIHDGKMSVADGKRILADMFRGTNANGVRVAKYVDDETARVMDYLRNNLVVPNHGAHYKDKKDADGNVIGREYVPSREAEMGADELMVSNEKKMNELLEKKINGDITEEEDIELLARQLYTPYLFAANARANVKEVRAEGEKMYEDMQRKKAEMGDAYTKEMRDADYAALEANSLHLVEAKAAYDEALTEYNETLGNVIMEGRDNLRMFREGKEAHKAEVVGMAIKAIGGEAKETSDGLTVWERLSRGGRKSIGVTYWTFDTACREIDRFAPNGEGEFYKHFMGGWREASNAFFTRTENHVLSICEAVGRITGSGKDSRRALRKFIETADWTDVGKIRYKNGEGIWEETRLKVSNALFVLAMWDQAQYRDIMTKRGVTQEVIDSITAKIASIDEHYLDFKDWVVQEFLPTTRLEYNEVHKQVFGASMDNIENYFPAKVVKGYAEEDLNRGEQLLPSTITGSIITRKNHSENIKYNQSFFSVLLNHLQNMDQWASFTPLVEDLTAVLSSPEFSRLANEYKPGVGEDKGGAGSLKQILRETGAIAVGSYTSKADDADAVLRFITGAWAASNITFRFSTALKQMSGLSAVFTSGLGMTQAYFAKNLFSSIGWAYKNSPMFKKRWGDGVAGNEALLEKYSNRTDIDLKRRKIEYLFDKAKEYLRLLTVNMGMFANRAVDAWVTAVTMRTVYDVTLREITKGKPETATEEQKSYAMMKAEIFANETQQSSEGAYLSVPQRQRSVVTAAATVYMNAPFASHRLRVQGVQDIYRWLNSDYRNEINTRYGEGAARKAASKGLGRLVAGISIDASFILMSQALGQGLWNLIIDWFDDTEDDDDEAEPINWKEIGLDIAIQIATGGYLWLSQIPSLAGGHRPSLAPPLTELFKGVMNFLGWNEYKLREGDFSIDLYWWALGEIMFKYGLGVDPETMLNIARGIEGICRDKDPMAAMKILNTPQSMVNIIAGPRRDNETVKEYVERRARLEVLFAQPKYSELYDDEGKFIGKGKYDVVGGAKDYRLKSLFKEYNERQRATVMSKYLSPSEVAEFERIDSEYKAIVESLGWEVGNNPEDNMVDKTTKRYKYPNGLTNVHYTALKEIATAAERTRRAQDRWVGTDMGYADLVRKEYNLREQLIAGRKSSYKAKTAKEKIDRAEKQRKKNQKK